jgi:leucyl-tRNA synthetase
MVKDDELDVSRFKKGQSNPENIFFYPNEEIYKCGEEVEKMSKSKYNVVTPDAVIEKYGADTLRMYEMFLGPLEMSKPWSTQGISGVHNFLKRFWNMFFNSSGEWSVVGGSAITPSGGGGAATPAELKILHKTIKKIEEDIERLSFNTSVSAFMICLNELQPPRPPEGGRIGCNKREILEPLVIILSPFAPHIAEELWHLLGHSDSVFNAKFPTFNEAYLKENTFNYPVSFNGKTRFMLELPLSLTKEEIEKEVLSSEAAMKWLSNATLKKVIVVPNKIVNIVI